MKYYVYIDGISVYDLDDKELILIDPVVSERLNEAPTFEFMLPPHNIYYDIPKLLKSRVRVNDSEGNNIFYGRINQIEIDFWKNKKIYCEGALAWLNDTIQPVYESDSFTIRSFLDYVLKNHNAEVEEEKQIELGEVEVESDETIYRSLDHELTYNAIKDMVLGTNGGYIYSTYQPSSIKIVDKDQNEYQFFTEEENIYYDSNGDKIDMPDTVDADTVITADDGNEYTIKATKNYRITDNVGNEYKCHKVPSVYIEYNGNKYSIDIINSKDGDEVSGLEYVIESTKTSDDGSTTTEAHNYQVYYSILKYFNDAGGGTLDDPANDWNKSSYKSESRKVYVTDKNSTVTIYSKNYNILDFDEISDSTFFATNRSNGSQFGIVSKRFANGDRLLKDIDLRVNSSVTYFVEEISFYYKKPNNNKKFYIFTNSDVKVNHDEIEYYAKDKYNSYHNITNQPGVYDWTKTVTVKNWDSNSYDRRIRDSSYLYYFKQYLSIVSPFTFNTLYLIYLSPNAFSSADERTAYISEHGITSDMEMPVIVTVDDGLQFDEPNASDKNKHAPKYALYGTEPIVDYAVTCELISGSTTQYTTKVETAPINYTVIEYYDNTLYTNTGELAAMGVIHHTYFIDLEGNKNYINKNLTEEQRITAKDGNIYDIIPDKIMPFLNYVEKLSSISNQNALYGSNLMDLSVKEDAANVYTVLWPSGKDDLVLGKDKSTIGDNLVQNDELVEKFGKIIKTRSYSDIKETAKLKTKTVENLEKHKDDYYSIEAEALDLHYENPNYDLYRISQQARIISKPHGINAIYPIKEITVTLSTGVRTAKIGTLIDDDFTTITKPISEASESKKSSGSTTIVAVARPSSLSLRYKTTSSTSAGKITAKSWGEDCIVICTYTNGNQEDCTNKCHFSPASIDKLGTYKIKITLYYNTSTGGLIYDQTSTSSSVSTTEELTVSSVTTLTLNNSVNEYVAWYQSYKGEQWGVITGQSSWNVVITPGTSNSIGVSNETSHTFTGWFADDLNYGLQYGSTRVTDKNGYPVKANTTYTNADGTWKNVSGTLYARYSPHGDST